MDSEHKMLYYVRCSFIEILCIPLRIGISILFLYLSMSFLENNIFMFLLILACSLFCGWLAFTPFLEYKKMVNFLRSNNIYDSAVSDFPIALPFLNDHIRLGNEYVFGKNFYTILKYVDIRRVYQSVRKVNFIERNRWLMAVDKENNIWTLCKLENHAWHNSKHNEITDQQPIKVLDFMLYKNNRIAVGYI